MGHAANKEAMGHLDSLDQSNQELKERLSKYPLLEDMERQVADRWGISTEEVRIMRDRMQIPGLPK